MSRYFDIRSTVLVVVGHGLLPEEVDRPVAYELRRAINARGRAAESEVGVVLTVDPVSYTHLTLPTILRV